MLKTTTNIIETNPEGILISKMHTKSGFKKVYIIEQANLIKHSYNGEKQLLLINLTRIEKPGIDDIAALICEETRSIASAVGIVVSSSIQKVLLNTYLGLKMHRANCPVQVFVSQGTALDWLSQTKTSAA